jgi:hypothetical protein
VIVVGCSISKHLRSSARAASTVEPPSKKNTAKDTSLELTLKRLIARIPN